MAKVHAGNRWSRELETAWKALSSKLEADGEYNLAALLNLDSPRLKNKVEIHLNFPNKTNKLELESEKERLSVHLLMS